MRYIYYLAGDEPVIRITRNNSDDSGELIGTSDAWPVSPPHTKKFILNSLMRMSGHQNITGVKIVDCDNPKDSDSQ